MKTPLLKILLTASMTFSGLTAAYAEPIGSASAKRHFFIGSSFFMLGNLTEEAPDYYRLDLGFKMTPRDFIILQPLTWRYPAPIGIPYTSEAFGKKTVRYPGYVRSFGMGLGYNRVLWKGLFAALYATPFRVEYHGLDDGLIRSGFQLFLQFQLDYRFEFFKKMFYIEPGLTCNYWPVNTNMPRSFRSVERDWPNYFLFEPVLNFGFNISF